MRGYRVWFFALVACVFLLLPFQSSAEETKSYRCCSWDYSPGDWSGWHPVGPSWTQSRIPCYGCGTDPTKLSSYTFQRGYWDINMEQVISCNDCPAMITCDQCRYQACNTQSIHKHVTRLTYLSGQICLPNMYDRWQEWYVSQPCCNLKESGDE